MRAIVCEMALFGRQSAADRRRAERIRAWARARSPFALTSGLLGILAVVDSFTGILGVGFGVAAVVCAHRGLRDIRARPGLRGRRLCVLRQTLGMLGIGILVWVP